MLKEIIKGVLTLQPDWSPRALRDSLLLLILIIREWPAVSAFVKRMSKALGRKGFERLGLDTIGVVHWPYISKQWPVAERLDAVASHYELIAGQHPFLLLGRNEQRLLCDLSEQAPGCALVLDRASWFKREGELVLNLFQGELRVASLAFSLRRAGGELCFFIGAVQGMHKGVGSDTSLAIYRDLTKAFEGLRPKSLLIETLKCLARSLGVERIYAVSDECRHHRHRYFPGSKADDLLTNYDVIWLENGAEPSPLKDFFSLPLASVRRAPETIAPKKRAMYRRRQALLDKLFGHIESLVSTDDKASRVKIRRRLRLRQSARISAANQGRG